MDWLVSGVGLQVSGFMGSGLEFKAEARLPRLPEALGFRGLGV